MKAEGFSVFYKKHKMVIGLAILTMMIMVSFLVEPFWYFSSLAVVLFFITCNFGEQIASVVYLSLFSGISQIYITALLICFLCTAIRYILDLKRKSKPFYAKPFILTTVFLIIFTLIHGQVDIEGFFNWALVFCLFYFIYFVYIYHKEIDVKKCFNYLIFAVIFSCVLASIAYPTGLIERVFFIDSVDIKRLRLFTRNSNHLAITCLFAIAFYIYDIINDVMKDAHDLQFLKQKHFWIDFAKIVLCFIVGILTMSKAFLVMICFFAVYFLAYLIYKVKLKSLFIIIPILLILVVLCFVFKDFVKTLIYRFVAYTNLESKISQIFTGRTDIWETYRDSIRGSIIHMLFGVGLLTKDIVNIGPHNVLIYFIHRVGFVGFIMICVIMYFYFKSAKSKIKITYKNSLLFVSFLILAIEEMIFSDRFFLFLVFGILLMIVPKEQIQNNGENQTSQNNEKESLKNLTKNNEME